MDGWREGVLLKVSSTWYFVRVKKSGKARQTNEIYDVTALHRSASALSPPNTKTQNNQTTSTELYIIKNRTNIKIKIK